MVVKYWLYDLMDQVPTNFDVAEKLDFTIENLS